MLFDVDGVLVDGSGPTHVGAFADALAAAVPGAPDPFRVEGGVVRCVGEPVAGLVDGIIARRCLATAGLFPRGAERRLGDFVEHLVSAYWARVNAGEPVGRVLDGVGDLLDALGQRGDYCGLLTGNTAQICEAKLGWLGLWGRFCCGAFGDGARGRRELFTGALRSARRAGWPGGPVVYLGDTPRDVAAAHAVGVAAVAVATGSYGVEALAWSNPDAVLESLRPAGKALAAIDAAVRSVRALGDRVDTART